MSAHTNGLSETTVTIFRTADQLMQAVGYCSDQDVADLSGHPTALVRESLRFLGEDYLDIKPNADGSIQVLGVSTEPPQDIR